jgi:hypothetical protein
VTAFVAIMKVCQQNIGSLMKFLNIRRHCIASLVQRLERDVGAEESKLIFSIKGIK